VCGTFKLNLGKYGAEDLEMLKTHFSDGRLVVLRFIKCRTSVNDDAQSRGAKMVNL